MSTPPGEPPYPGNPSWQSPPPPPPGQPPGYGGYGDPASVPPIPNYLVWSILTTIFCCLPFGIVSIVHAAKVDGLRAAGDIPGAMDASRKAKNWAIWAVAGWGVLALLYVVFFFIIGISFFAELGELQEFQ